MANIIFDSIVLTTLRDESASAYHNNEIELSYLMDHCPHFEAMYRETMRVVNGALSARKIVARTPMGNKVLRSGNTILIPFRQLHYNKDAFGNDPGTFSPNCFLKEKYLKNSWSFKPFGGGVNYCPGRFLAKQEMLYFVALFLHRSDFEFA